MNYPKNCTECEHTNTCKRYYGAIGCKYEKEIVKAILEQYERDYGQNNQLKRKDI